MIEVYFNPIQAGEPRPSKELWAPMIKVSLIVGWGKETRSCLSLNLRV
jgi:hypothetical protein